MNITFWGAARTVTGSKHLITTDSGKQILLDCGLFQGMGQDSRVLNQKWGFDPSSISYVILSHAHIDHTGLLPKLVKDGFKGKIYATNATIDLCEIMLLDSAHIQESDLKYINKRRKEKNQPLIEPLYDEQDATETLQRMVEIGLNSTTVIDDELSVTTTENGHILGSVALHLDLKRADGRVTQLTFTGDIGREGDAILNGPVKFPQSEYIICESTYGNRLHGMKIDVETKLLEIVNKTCVEQRGKVIIPAFSIDRTQEIVYALDKLENAGKLPKINVYVDSPLSVKATKVMNENREYFNKNIMEYITRDGNPFDFPYLHYVQSAEESKKINEMKEPAIIISASGMAEAGRIKHHIKNNIEKEKNTILLVGYASPESLAGKLKAGEPEVMIFGDPFKVKARIEVLESFSAHADYEEMIKYLLCQNTKEVKQLILVHGEYDVQMEFAQKLNEVGFGNIVIPEMGDVVEIP
mgnify:CR=1 FL=1